MPLTPARHVLIVEDEASFREVLELGLGPEGFLTHGVASLGEAKAALSGGRFDVVLSDLRLKDGSGIDLLSWMKEREDATPVVIMTAYATTETTVNALTLGATDFLTKTKNDINEVTKLLKNLFVTAPGPTGEVVEIGDLGGVSETIRKVQALVGKVALADTTVLLTGESGTGKEVVARLIHRYSERSRGPFVPVNCGALPENLLESELFGYEKGAFTGAAGVKRGLFEEASSGVIFLDEIGEMPLSLQVKLLRVLQERKIRRLGATEERPVDVRVIGATNRNLLDQVNQGRFREDLYYRLNILHIDMPPLRERPEDLPVLTEHFLKRFCAKLGKPPMSMSSEALTALQRYGWRGNVRELENLVERCVALHAGPSIGVDLLPEALLEAQPEPRSVCAIPAEGFDLDKYLVALKAYLLRSALDRCDGNRTRAARLLGMSFRAYRYWLQELGGPEALPVVCPNPSAFPAAPPPEGDGDV
jgi:two-component system, NtrC family, response regulator PilR